MRRLAVRLAVVALLALLASEAISRTDTVAPPAVRDVVEVSAARPGVLSFVGRVGQRGENVPPGEVRTVLVGGVRARYVPLREGDRVEEGQLLGRIDDRLARKEIDAREA